MKQLFYIVGFIVLIIIAQRIMNKVKNVPPENPTYFPEEQEDTESENLNEKRKE